MVRGQQKGPVTVTVKPGPSPGPATKSQVEVVHWHSGSSRVARPGPSEGSGACAPLRCAGGRCQPAQQARQGVGRGTRTNHPLRLLARGTARSQARQPWHGPVSGHGPVSLAGVARPGLRLVNPHLRVCLGLARAPRLPGPSLHSDRVRVPASDSEPGADSDVTGTPPPPGPGHRARHSDHHDDRHAGAAWAAAGRCSRGG